MTSWLDKAIAYRLQFMEDFWEIYLILDWSLPGDKFIQDFLNWIEVSELFSNVDNEWEFPINECFVLFCFVY